MEALLVLFRLLAAATGLYWFMCLFRVLMSMFLQGRGGRAEEALSKICDPYLGLFRRIRWLKAGGMDFSPVFAIVLLAFAFTFFQLAQAYSYLTFGILLSTLIQLIGSGITYVIGFFAVLMGLRLLLFLLRPRMDSVAIGFLGRMIDPIAQGLSSFLFKNRLVKYSTSLGIGLAVTVALAIAVDALVGLLAGLALRLPF
jgi:YggT family protein